MPVWLGKKCKSLRKSRKSKIKKTWKCLWSVVIRLKQRKIESERKPTFWPLKSGLRFASKKTKSSSRKLSRLVKKTARPSDLKGMSNAFWNGFDRLIYDNRRPSKKFSTSSLKNRVGTVRWSQTAIGWHQTKRELKCNNRIPYCQWARPTKDGKTLTWASKREYRTIHRVDYISSLRFCSCSNSSRITWTQVTAFMS